MTQNEPHPPRLRYIIGIAISTLGVGVIFYHIVEKLSWLDSIYFCIITLTTIGYGDIVPKTDAGKVFTIFYVLIGISLLGATANFLLKHTLIHRQHIHDERTKADKK